MLVFGFLLLTKSEQGLQGLGFGCFLIVLSHLRTLLINPEPVPAGPCGRMLFALCRVPDSGTAVAHAGSKYPKFSGASRGALTPRIVQARGSFGCWLNRIKILKVEGTQLLKSPM